METTAAAMEVVEDRISGLPDDLIVTILSFLNMEDAVPTSLLSKRWRYMWTFNPNLVFPPYSNGSSKCRTKSRPNRRKFGPGRSKYGKCSVAAINQCTQLYNANRLHKLDINLSITGDSSKEIEECINFAINKQVQHLSVIASQYGRKLLRYLAPESLFSSESLQELALGGCELYPLPWHIERVDSLKRLHLQEVKVSYVALQSLLSKCHHLQSLALLDLHLDVDSLVVSMPNLLDLRMDLDLEYLVVSMPNLLDLRMHCIFHYVEIDAPKLQSLTCKGRIYNRFTVKSVPNLLKLKLDFSTRLGEAPVPQGVIVLGSTMESFSNVNFLRLRHPLLELICAEYDLKGRRRIRFNNLKEFHLDGIVTCRFSIHSLASFLRCCPTLVELHIHDWFSASTFNVDWECLSSEFGNFFLDHLELVKMTLASSGDARITTLVRFLLEKAPLLDKMIIRFDPGTRDYYHDFLTEIFAYDFLTEIFAFPKASANATILPLDCDFHPITFP